MNSVLHIVIVWSTAKTYKEEIVSDIKKNFEFLRTIKVHWESSLFYKNLKIFYSHSLKDKSEDEMDRILKGKIKTVGRGDFYVIVFRDNNPQMEQRVTTSGTCIVNTKIFDIKERYRKTVGGSKIHSSNDAWETNKDLSILFGQNSEDFIKKNSIGNSYNKNCVGVNGYDSFEQLFYILNNTIDYCVLRNFEGIPEQYTLEGHDDIDLLVAHKKYAVRLTDATPKFPQDFRVYHFINIKGKQVAFDFRHIGDDYYDEKWQRDILSKRVLNKSIFYIPDKENCYYSLLYHAYVQKPKIKNDYFPKLRKYAKEIGIEYQQSVLCSMIQLYGYLKVNGYNVTRAKDKSVYFNINNNHLVEGYYHLKSIGLHDLVSVHEDRISKKSGYVYFEGNYEGKMVFVKYGGISDSCKNEYKFSKLMWETDICHYVEPIFNGNHNGVDYIVFNYCKGIPVEAYLDNEEKIVSISKQLIQIYKELQSNKVIHRDIRPENFCVEDGNLKLFDFQYALNTEERKELLAIKDNEVIAFSLGTVGKYRYKTYAWRDSYSFLQVAKTLGLYVTKNDLKPKDGIIFVNLRKFIIFTVKKEFDAIKSVLKK